jgi:hypothetical protein
LKTSLATWLPAGLILAALLPRALPAAPAQKDNFASSEATTTGEKKASSSRMATKPSQPPAFQVAVGPLGYSAPDTIDLGHRYSLVSLDFLDENRLLFTFRVPGLIRREAGSGERSEEREIRAVVLELPSGRVEAEALWTLHDQARYLWMLKDGSFLLRDGDELKKGDATLELKPFLRFPGPLLWLETDPLQQYLATGSEEPAAAQPGEAINQTGQTNQAGQTRPNENADLVVRILRRDSGQVMLVSRPHASARLPINSDGYLESLRSSGIEWQVNLHSFTGGVTTVGRLDSACAPSYDFVSQHELVATACNSLGGHQLVAMTSEGRRLWETQLPEIDLWPRLTPSPDGSRLARETLTASRVGSASAPLTTEDIKGQLVEIYEAANGKVALTVPVHPAFDGGGNVAISPSGRRVAVLNSGFVQIFALPAPLLVPDTLGNHPPQ